MSELLELNSETNITKQNSKAHHSSIDATNDLYLKEYYFKVFKEHDHNQDGKIDYETFCEIINKENSNDKLDKDKLARLYKDTNREIDFKRFFRLLEKINQNYREFLITVSSAPLADSVELNELTIGLKQENE